MPAGRAIVHWAASTIGTAMPAGSTAAGDANGIGRYCLAERDQRHGPRRRNHRKAEANRKHRCNQYLHSHFPFSFLSLKFAATRRLRTYANNAAVRQGKRASPVTAVPVMAVPVAVMPTPVAMMPTPVMPVPVMSPVYLLGFQVLNLGLCGHRGTNIPIRRWQLLIFRKRTRQQRRGLSGGGQCGRSGGKSNGDFQKMAAFHDTSPCSCAASDARRV